MLKKSLLLSTALLTAVLLVFTGCEGPTGPSGQRGETEVGSVDVTIKGPDAAAPLLPEGVTYPDGNAKVLAGNAADIALAFNGGILVSDTGDYGNNAPAAIQGGDATVYAQEPVDAVIWTGSGAKVGANLGSISVPPGKTLYINAPLTLGAVAAPNVFTAISISDAGTINASVVQQSVQGGAPVNTARGKVVLLSGGSITGGVGSITNGGVLELHRGAQIEGNGSIFTAVSGSETLVYGEIWDLTGVGYSFDGLLDIKAGGKVTTASVLNGVINGQVKVDGELEVDTGLTFRNTVEVGETGLLDFDAAVTFANKVTLNGGLDIAGIAVTLYGPASHLEITAKGSISATAWSQFRYDSSGADDEVLLAALADSSPNDDNFHITIAAGSGVLYLDVGTVTASSYANLVKLAASETLHLERINYSASLSAADREILLKVVKDNAVYLSTAGTIGDVEVQAGGSLVIDGIVTTAGDIAVTGGGRPEVATFNDYPAFVADASTFADGLKSLTIGDAAGTATGVSLPDATLAAGGNAASVITVHKNASLTLDPDLNINPPGKIDLEAGDPGKGGKLLFDSPYSGSSAAVTFAALKEISIGAGAEFNATDRNVGTSYPIDTITFASLTKLKVDGTLTVPSGRLTYVTTTNETPFYKLQNDVDASTDVTGDGKAVFSGWAVNGTDLGHAFDQILGIKDVTVASVTNVPGTSGFAEGVTPDRATTKGDGYKLRVNTITAPGSLLIDRDLYVAGTISFGTATPYSITVGSGTGVYSGMADSGLVLGGSAQTGNATLTSTSSVTLAAGTGLFSNSGALTLQTGGVLQIPGTLSVRGGAFATEGSGITIGSDNVSPYDSYLTKAAVSSVQGSVGVTVNNGGTLGIGAASTAALGSTIALAGTGKVVAANTITLTFATNTVLTGGTLQISEGNNAAIATRLIPAAGSNPAINEAEISGNITLSVGTLAYTHVITPTLTRLTLSSGKIKARTGVNAYDTAELGGTVITKAIAGTAVTFNGATGTIALGADDTIVAANGSLTTTGTGRLAFTNVATLATGTNTSGQAATLTLPELRGNGIEGNLALSNNSLLTLSGAFNVLSTATATASAQLSISGSAKVVGAGSLVLLGATGQSGSFTNGTFTLTGNGTAATYTGIESVTDWDDVTLGLEDFYGAFGTTGSIDGTFAAGSGSEITSFATTVTIPLVANKSLTAASKLYSSD